MPYYRDEAVTLHLGDCRDVMAAMKAGSVDAVVTDPPYELGFMGRQWDSRGVAYDVTAWERCLRVLKPGGHLLAFGGTRTYHRMVCAIEDAGFEIRDSLHWVYGSGFPKSMDVSKAIDKAAGAQREVVGLRTYGDGHTYNGGAAAGRSAGHMGNVVAREPSMATAPATEDAARWGGWGTALKPAHEPIVVARKPLTGTVASNVLQWGAGAVNIDGCRVAHVNGENPSGARRAGKAPGREAGSWANDRRSAETYAAERPGEAAGRWPPNFLLTHSADCNGECVSGCPVAEMDSQSGISKSSGGRIGNKDGGQIYGGGKGLAGDYSQGDPGFGDSGGASRFFPVFRYQAKAPTSERPKLADGTAWPTVKPLDLMRWLVRLVTPPGGTVLDPFCGTGTTGEAAALEGFSSLLIERDPVAAELAVQRLSKPSAVTLFG